MKHIWIILLILAVALLVACTAKPEPGETGPVETELDWNAGIVGDPGAGLDAKDNESGLVRFHYSYGGSMAGNDYSYEIRQEDGVVTFTYESMLYPWGEMSCRVGPEVLNALNDIYLRLRLAEWDGFSQTDTNVLDGDGFGLSLGFADGGSLYASGSNTWPERYRQFEEAMEEVCGPLAEKTRQAAMDTIIENGMPGRPTQLMLYISQSGESGSDVLNVSVSLPDGRENFSVKLETQGFGRFEPGTYRYDAALEELHWEELEAILEKHQIIRWFGFDETAEDYKNAEWFQLSLVCEPEEEEAESWLLNAMGSAHPDNYEAFRADFFGWLYDVIQAGLDAGVLAPIE